MRARGRAGDGAAAKHVFAALAVALLARPCGVSAQSWPAQSVPPMRNAFCTGNVLQSGSFTYAQCTAACDASATCVGITVTYDSVTSCPSAGRCSALGVGVGWAWAGDRRGTGGGARAPGSCPLQCPR